MRKMIAIILFAVFLTVCKAFNRLKSIGTV